MSLPALKKNLSVCLIPAIVLVILALFGFGPGGDDDTHITYTAAIALAEQQAVLNNNGEFVEQSSSLLHVLTLAVFYQLSKLFNADLMMADIGPVFSLLIAVLCLPLASSLSEKLKIQKPFFVLTLISVSLSFGYWSMGGLESSLAAFCFLYLVLIVGHLIENYERTKQLNLLNPHFYLSLLVFLMVRPESMAVIVAILLTLLVILFFQRKLFLTPVLVYVLITAAVFFGLLCLWRYYYFGQLLPQPVYAKADGISFDKLVAGFLYYFYAMQLTLMIYVGVVLAFVYLLFSYKIDLSAYSMTCLSASCAYLAFIFLSGGDWMTGGRFFVPIIPLLACLFCLFFQHKKYFKTLYVVIVCVAVVEVSLFVAKMSTGVNLLEVRRFDQAYNRLNAKNYSWSETANLVHLRDVPMIDAMIDIIDQVDLDKNTPLTITSIQMGMVPFHLSQRYKDHLQFVDMRGLTSQEATRCRLLASAQRNWLGVKASYRRYFSVIQSNECPRLKKPDIVYDLLNRSPEDNQKRLEILHNAGYHLVYLQKGVVEAPNTLKELDAKAFISVSPAIHQQLSTVTRFKVFAFSD